MQYCLTVVVNELINMLEFMKELRKRINERLEEFKNLTLDSSQISEYGKGYNDGTIVAYTRVLGMIDSMQKEEQPKHGFVESVYHVGTEPRWNVGDVLAEYIMHSDEEGEFEYGEVESIDFDEEWQDWMYHFKDAGSYYEESLISSEAYKKG